MELLRWALSISILEAAITGVEVVQVVSFSVILLTS